MRIVDVCAFYAPRGGGVRTYIDQKLALARKLGIDVSVVVPGEADCTEERGPGARIVSIASPRLPLDRKYGYFADEAKLHAVLDRLAPGFVEVSSPWRSPVMVSNWRAEIPRALVMHADPLAAYAYRWLGPFLEREAIDRRLDGYWQHLRNLGRSFDSVICASADLAVRLEAGGILNTQLIPMGVEEGRFSPALRDLKLRQSLLAECGLGNDGMLLLAVGRLAPEKRVPMLVEAATIAGRARPMGLVIFGEGRERRAILRAIRGNPHIRLMQPERSRSNFAAIMASCDALVHGCEAETFCMAAAEARASGLPVIVPDRGGAADFARNGGGIRYCSAELSDLATKLTNFEMHGTLVGRDVLPRTMEDHFSELVVHYSRLVDGARTLVA